MNVLLLMWDCNRRQLMVGGLGYTEAILSLRFRCADTSYALRQDNMLIDVFGSISCQASHNSLCVHLSGSSNKVSSRCCLICSTMWH